MKFDFLFHNPTKIYFGKKALNNLSKELKRYGPKVLLAYGGGSIKKIGLYDQIMTILQQENKEVYELANIMPNPTYTKMMEGANLVKEHQIDFILAVGGGSVIDCAKGISVSAYATNPWERYWLKNEQVDNPIVPVGAILTMVGTGSEMNGGSVITHEEQKRKQGRPFPPTVFPHFAILNPELTYSVSRYQMVSGIFDILSHLHEQYFSGDDDNVSDYLIEGLYKSVIRNTKVALVDPTNYEARSNIMWAATLGLNRLVGLSKEQDWQVHLLEHQVGAYTDCAHGMGLSALTIPYFKTIYPYGLAKFVRYATEIWNVDPSGKTQEDIALQGIEALATFIKECGMATTLKELGTTKEMLPLIADSTSLTGHYKKMNKEDILKILEEAYE